MLRQRILAAVIVRQTKAVQSFGYERWLPLGDVGCIVQNLDRWGADGIVVLCTDRANQGPDLNLLNQLSALELSTPLTYGGGIQTEEHARQVVQAGAERIVVDQLLSDKPDQLPLITAAVGKQALIAAIPLVHGNNGEIHHWKHWCKRSEPLEEWLGRGNCTQHVSELLAIDVKSEGSGNGPDSSLMHPLGRLNLPILAFGGLSSPNQLASVLEQPNVAAAVLGNTLNYREQSIRYLKEGLTSLPLRPHPTSTSLQHG